MISKMKNVYQSAKARYEAGKALGELKASEHLDMTSKRGQMMGTVIGVIVGIVLLVAVAIPVTQEVINSANLTGTASTVVGLVPLFLAIGAMILATRVFNR